MDRRNHPNANGDSDRDSNQGRREPSPPRNPNVFDDEYALDPDEDDFMPAVSDGFRPAGMGGSASHNHNHNHVFHGAPPDHDREAPPRPPATSKPVVEGDLRRIASRNSTMKPAAALDSLPHDARNPAAHTRGHISPATSSLPHRVSISSTGSFATMARSESPFSTGPSHPYGMYPQNTMARSPSVTTSSTQQQPHRSVSLSRPAHPYGMYTQNVIEDEEPTIPVAQTTIPLGFPGLNTGFHRRLGPDGEEQDIVGPDGHMEQLPPYSRYPTEGPTKAALVAEANATPVDAPVDAPQSPINAFDDANAVSPVTPISPLHAAPPPLAVQSRNVPPQPPAAPSAAEVVSTTSLQSPESSDSEKTASRKEQTSWRSKRLWGKIPMSVVLILLVLVLIFAIILGAAIGTFVAKNKDKGDDDGRPKHGKDHEEPSPQVTGPSHSLFDATPIPTPSNLPPLPIGQFALPLGIAQESSPSCLIQANQLSAWSCKMSFAPLVLTINSTNLPGSRPLASLDGFTKPDGAIQYGIQPPVLPLQPLPMQLVLDLDYKAYGPAFHFAARYDKIVVLSPDEFAAGAAFGSDLLPREQPSPTSTYKPSYRRRFQVLPGDTPWFCVWNGTYIEGYVFATDNSTAATFSQFPTAWPTNYYGSSIPVETPAPSSTPPITMTATTITPNGPMPPIAELSETPSPIVRKRRGDGDYPRYPPYPRIVKIEERRLPDSLQPYCQKMRLFDNGQLLPALDGAGHEIIIPLQENDPDLEEFFEANDDDDDNDDLSRRAMLEKRRDPPGACHCQWMFQ